MSRTYTGMDGQPAFEFTHNGQDYLIWLWLSDGGPDVSKACLATPRDMGNGTFVPNNVLTESAYTQAVEAAGGTQEFMRDVFLPKVNEYLAAQGGSTPDFPVDGNDMEQFNWIVENSLSYSNGVVSMS